MYVMHSCVAHTLQEFPGREAVKTWRRAKSLAKKLMQDAREDEKHASFKKKAVRNFERQEVRRHSHLLNDAIDASATHGTVPIETERSVPTCTKMLASGRRSLLSRSAGGPSWKLSAEICDIIKFDKFSLFFVRRSAPRPPCPMKWRKRNARAEGVSKRQRVEKSKSHCKIVRHELVSRRRV